jgi:hypothetical protein
MRRRSSDYCTKTVESCRPVFTRWRTPTSVSRWTVKEGRSRPASPAQDRPTQCGQKRSVGNACSKDRFSRQSGLSSMSSSNGTGHRERVGGPYRIQCLPQQRDLAVARQEPPRVHLPVDFSRRRHERFNLTFGEDLRRRKVPQPRAGRESIRGMRQAVVRRCS